MVIVNKKIKTYLYYLIYTECTFHRLACLSLIIRAQINDMVFKRRYVMQLDLKSNFSFN